MLTFLSLSLQSVKGENWSCGREDLIHKRNTIRLNP